MKKRLIDRAIPFHYLTMYTLVKLKQQLNKNMNELQEILSDEEVAQLNPEDVTHYESKTINNEVYEFYGDLDAPVLFEIREEGKSIIAVRGWSTHALISFGNYLLSPERQKLVNQTAELLSQEPLQGVSHADTENWKFRQDESTNDGIISNGSLAG